MDSAYWLAIHWLEGYCDLAVVDPSYLVFQDLKTSLTAVKKELVEIQVHVAALSMAGKKAVDRVMGLTYLYHPNCQHHNTCRKIERVLFRVCDDLLRYRDRVGALLDRMTASLVRVMNNPIFEADSW